MAYIGVDIGTSGCKAAILWPDGSVIASAHRAYSFVSPRPGWAELDPNEVWGATLETLRELAPLARDVHSLAIGSIGESMVMTDADDTILYNAINYVDNRCADTIPQIERIVPAPDIRAVTGMPMNQMYSLHKLFWFRRHRPDVMERTRKIFLFTDYFGYRLTGKRLVDPSSASRTMLVDLWTRDWSPELMRAFGVDRALFSDIAPAGSRVGTLLDSVAAETGLSPDIEVLLGSHDQPCCNLGAGLLRRGDVLLGEGSSESLNMIVERGDIVQPLLDSGIGLEPFFEDKYFATAALLTHGTSIRWFVEAFRKEIESFRDAPEESVYALADRLCAEDAASVFFLPYMSGVDPNDGDNDARGAFVGLDVTVNVWQMYRAVLEGLAFETRFRLDMLGQGGVPLGVAIAAGGASKSPRFMQMKADVLGRPLAVLQNGEVGITGLCMLCAVAKGDYAGYAEAAEAFVATSATYRPGRADPERYEKYKIINACLRDMHRRLR